MFSHGLKTLPHTHPAPHLLCSQKLHTESGKPERDARVSWWRTDLNRYSQIVVDQDRAQNPSFQKQSVHLSIYPSIICLSTYQLAFHLPITYLSMYHLYASLLSIYHLSSSTYYLSITFIIYDHTFIIYYLTVYPALIYASGMYGYQHTCVEAGCSCLISGHAFVSRLQSL